MNVFLTGGINCGKTTIINRYLQNHQHCIAGFRTVREKTLLDDYFGVYLLDAADEDQLLCRSNRVGSCHQDKTLTSYGEVFDALGVKLLTYDTKADLVIMDELGVLEQNSRLFQERIFQILDADTNVLGVLKDRKNQFLDSIRNRQDVIVLMVDRTNNEEILVSLENLFCAKSW